jgi:hypothetical protein
MEREILLKRKLEKNELLNLGKKGDNFDGNSVV